MLCFFCGITQYSQHLLHIMLIIILNISNKIMYYVILFFFLLLLNIITYLLNMLVLVIIKLCKFYVLIFCGITYYSQPLLHNIILKILFNVSNKIMYQTFYQFFLVLLNIIRYLLNMLVLVIIKLCNFHDQFFCGVTY